MDVNTANKQGLTILMCAAKNGDLELVKELIELKADVNHIILESENQGRTALHLAALAGHIEVVNYLITVAKANVKMTDAQGDTPYSSIIAETEQCEAILRSEPTVSESFYKRNKHQERKNQFEKLKLMKINLEEIGVDTHTPVKTIAQRARCRSYNCVALVVGTVKGNPVVVLGRKREHTTLQPEGFYLLPGGGVDSSKELAEDAVLRELKEETGISVDKNIAKHFYTYENLYEVGDSKDYVQTKFYIIDLGEKLAELKPKPGSDLAEVKILKWKDVTKEIHPVSKKISLQGYLINYIDNETKIRVTQSNALLVDSYFKRKKLNESDVNASLTLESRQGIDRFIRAMSNNDKSTLRLLIRQGIDINRTTVLINACAYGQQDMVSFLIQLGADVNAVYKNYYTFTTPLIAAIEKGHLELAKYLIEKHNANINISSHGRSALISACATKNIDFFKYLLVQKNVLLTQGIGGTVLLHLIMYKQESLVKELLAGSVIDLNQAYIFNSQNISVLNQSATPLMAAIQTAQLEVIKFLIKNGASIYLATDEKTNIFSFLNGLIGSYLLDIRYEQVSNRAESKSSFSMFESKESSPSFAKRVGVDFKDLKPVVELIISIAKENPKEELQGSLQRLEEQFEELGKALLEISGGKVDVYVAGHPSR